jgi:hypothetical protein
MTLITSIANFEAANASATRRIGFSINAPQSDPARGIYFRAIGTGNWYAVTRDASTETATDTGVAQSTNYMQFKIVTNSTGASIGFYIGNILKATHTTNLPTNVFTPSYQIESSHITNAYSISIDYFFLTITGLNR